MNSALSVTCYFRINKWLILFHNGCWLLFALHLFLLQERRHHKDSIFWIYVWSRHMSVMPAKQQQGHWVRACVRDWPVAFDQGLGVSSPDTVPVVWIDGVIVVAIMCLLLKTVTHTDAHTDRDAVQRHLGLLSEQAAYQPCQLSHTLWASVLFRHTLKNVNIQCYFWYHLKIIVNAKGLTFRWLLNKARYSIMNHLVNKYFDN